MLQISELAKEIEERKVLTVKPQNQPEKVILFISFLNDLFTYKPVCFFNFFNLDLTGLFFQKESEAFRIGRLSSSSSNSGRGFRKSL